MSTNGMSDSTLLISPFPRICVIYAVDRLPRRPGVMSCLLFWRVVKAFIGLSLFT